jgi:hypothetical protein
VQQPEPVAALALSRVYRDLNHNSARKTFAPFTVMDELEKLAAGLGNNPHHKPSPRGLHQPTHSPA